MKKFSALAFILAIILILSACGSSQDSSGDSKKGSSEPKKTLKVGTDASYAPFEYMDKGKITGFDVDFLKAVMKEAGYKYNLVNVGWDPLFVELKNKTSDLGISAITINDERKQTYDFSKAYFLSTNEILVPENSKIKSAADLKGKRIAVQSGTTGQEAVEKLIGKNNKNIKKFKQNTLAIQELIHGGADAVVADNTVVEDYAKNNPNQKLKVIADKKAFAPEYYGLMFPKGSKLKPTFDKAIETLYDNGTYEKIYKKWFKVKPDVANLKAQK
ncbi:transporter substrate-binding domain-containing protein [Terrilactibacillus sp. BCM23-1]|uniref:Transporter substrate-binding domain-containing protein n=1 Tax=Terrilactibacillus tamarindi TaxID=2599694 RepID=A0A6N8CV66_9BACI|nr:basic amino acid ABC transporter substrate-binding protein [Terrilactibacillus tamarindi]MTT33337.1 transporter substrate-binding domain-containing protein [Terrilactibacillus tamarindi]